MVSALLSNLHGGDGLRARRCSPVPPADRAVSIKANQQEIPGETPLRDGQVACRIIHASSCTVSVLQTGLQRHTRILTG